MKGKTVTNNKSPLYNGPNSSDEDGNVLIPIGKGPMPTSVLQNVLKNELKSRGQLEKSRKALIDREKARYNRQHMMYIHTPRIESVSQILQ